MVDKALSQLDDPSQPISGNAYTLVSMQVGGNWKSVKVPINLLPVVGQKGDQGVQGPQGIQGLKGDKGDKGDTGAKGDKGDTGATVTIKGSVATASGLPTSDIADTDSYIALDTGHLYVYGNGQWNDVGAIQGVKGDTGAKGDKGDKGDRGTAGATGADGQSGSSAYDSWFNANSDIEKYLLSRKAIDVLSNSQIQTLMAQTGLSLGFDDYLNSKLLIELYEDISNGGSITSHEFLNAAGLKTAYRSYLENYISASDYALVSSILTDPNNNSQIQSIGSVAPASELYAAPLMALYAFLQEQNPTLTVAHFATVDMPIINQLRLLDSPSTSVEDYVNNHTLLDIAVLKGLYIADANYDLALNRYLNTYMANTVILAGLSTYNVNIVIQNWIDSNTEAWFKQLPLLKIARKWTEM